MPQSEPISILIVNEHAEEIKLVTISLRGFFSDVRIEVAYSADEAQRMILAHSGAWALVLIDEGCLPQTASTLVTDLKRHAPYASIILQTSRTDSAAALEALHMGMDLFLYKHSPAFLTELLFCAKEAIDKRESRLAAARAEPRHSWQRPEEFQSVVRQVTELSQALEQPLSTLLRESQHLADTLRESRLLDRLQAFYSQAATSAELVQRLTRLADPTRITHVINRLLDDVLRSPGAGHSNFSPAFGSGLPDYAGDLETTGRFFQQLLAYADAYLATVERPHMLALATSAGGLADSADAPTLFPLPPSTHIHLTITETETVNPTERVGSSLPETLDVRNLYRLAGELGATLDVSAPAAGPFRMIVRLPTKVASAVHSAQPEGADAPTVDRSPDAPPAGPTAAAQDLVGAGRTERRNNPRAELTLPAKIARGSSTWQGTVVNLSVGGACIRLPDDFPATPPQEAVLWVTTAIATLELSGLAHMRTSTAADTGRSIQPEAQLIVHFRGPTRTETAVLASLIAAARERSLAFTLDVRLPTAPGLEATGQPLSPDLAEHDRRETVRVTTALTARLETPQWLEPATRPHAQVMNLSRSGACVVVGERPEALTGSLRIHFAPDHRSKPGSHEPGAPDAVLAARIIWTAADPTAPSAFHAPNTASAGRAGLRFESLTPYAERELNRVLRQLLRAQRSGEALSVPAPVVSVPRECRNARGQVIAITDDHLSQLGDPNRPTIIIAPGYGQTASDYTALSYYLAEHHFRLLRYDPTNHLGNSEGELQQTTLRSMQHDLEKVIEFVRHTWPQAPVVVLASDLAARAAFKIAAHTRPLDLLLLINPAIDVGGLLMAVHGHDLIADYQFGLRRGVCNLLGLNVNVDQFVGDVVTGHCADLESTLEDLRLNRSRLCIATSPADSTAFPPTDLPHPFMTALGTHTRLVNISSPITNRHLDVHGAPPAAFKQLLAQISAVLSVQPMSPQQEIAVQPYVARQHRLEQEYTFLRHDGSQINREALCAAHLAQLPHLGNVHEYRKLLDDLYGLMSPLEPGAILVDAGVGQSDLTRTTLVNHTYRAGQASWTGRPSPMMVGVGRSRERIGQARHAVLMLQRELATGFVGRQSAMPQLTIGWIQADWTNALPFKTGSVNRLICNLSLPYVPSPLVALKEWHRVLHPDGGLIFTTFHPNTDLSPLYRRHLRQANQDEFSTQAQPLLHYFARLREAIRHRILHAFDEPGLAALLRQCGIASFRILPIFDGQALVAIVGKQNSSSSLR